MATRPPPSSRTSWRIWSFPTRRTACAKRWPPPLTGPLAYATGAAHRAAWAGDDPLAVRLMRSNHLRELEADRRGAELLRRAGIAPDAMGRMLLKMARADGGAHSGSHPALETRLENLGLMVGFAR